MTCTRFHRQTGMSVGLLVGVFTAHSKIYDSDQSNACKYDDVHSWVAPFDYAVRSFLCVEWSQVGCKQACERNDHNHNRPVE